MKVKPGFELRDICGEQVIVAEGLQNIDFSKIISLNETAAYLWQHLQTADFTVADMTELLCREYDVEPAMAQADSRSLADQWLEAGIIEA